MFTRCITIFLDSLYNLMSRVVIVNSIYIYIYYVFVFVFVLYNVCVFF